MKCQCFGHSFTVPGRAGAVLQTAQHAARAAAATARLMVGVPDYAAYCAHMARLHPDVAPMDQAEFMRNRMAARFGAGGALRCC